MVISPFISIPLPPLKFRTVGFPQYGFKRDVETPSSALHPQRLHCHPVEAVRTRWKGFFDRDLHQR